LRDGLSGFTFNDPSSILGEPIFSPDWGDQLIHGVIGCIILVQFREVEDIVPAGGVSPRFAHEILGTA
jgi:hypothetical protein